MYMYVDATNDHSFTTGKIDVHRELDGYFKRKEKQRRKL